MTHQDQTGRDRLTAAWPSAIPVHLLLNTSLLLLLCHQHRPTLSPSAGDRFVWVRPAENKCTRWRHQGVFYSCHCGPGRSCYQPPWSTTMGNSSEQCTTAFLSRPVLWHHWTVFNVQWHFWRWFIFLTVWCFLVTLTALFALQINSSIVHMSSLNYREDVTPV